LHSHTILFLAANPPGTPPLDLASEARELRIALRQPGGHPFTLVTEWAVRARDVLSLLRDLKPTVVHFAGHGNRPGEAPAREEVSCRDIPAAPGEQPEDGVFLHGPDGRSAQLVRAPVFASTFRVVGASVKLVVLNACYSEAVAAALLRHVDCIVGMAGAIADDAARAFTAGFYGALAAGESIAQAFEQGQTAIPLDVRNGLTDATRPRLKVRDGVDPARWVLRSEGRLRRIARALGIEVRLGAHLGGPLGMTASCAILSALVLIAFRMWFAFGEPVFDVRVSELTVRASRASQPVQDNGELAAVEARASIVEGPRAAMADKGAHRIVLTGAFTSIDVDRQAPDDPACRARFAAQDRSITIERARPNGTPCRHDVIAIAGPEGLALAIDDAPALSIKHYDSVVLRMEPGTAVTLVPLRDQLALFWPAAIGTWQATDLQGNAAKGERVCLPGALRCGDSFELEGAVELRELRLDAGRLVVSGALRDWRGVIGDEDNWDAAVPWPRARTCWFAAVGLALLASAALVRARARWHAWGKDTG
jgi:hypothetical protein